MLIIAIGATVASGPTLVHVVAALVVPAAIGFALAFALSRREPAALDDESRRYQPGLSPWGLFAVCVGVALAVSMASVSEFWWFAAISSALLGTFMVAAPWILPKRASDGTWQHWPSRS